MTPQKSRSIRGVLLLALVAGCAGMMIWAAMARGEDDVGPEASPAAATSQATTMTDEQFRQMVERDSIGTRRPEFTHDEWVAMDRPLDRQVDAGGNYTLDDQAFYILLRHVMKDMADGSDADLVNVNNLLREPLRYRARPVKLKLQFNKVEEYEPARSDPYEKVYFISAFVPMARGEPQAVFVISPFKPDPMEQKKEFETVGYFYKVVLANRGAAEVPVLIARKVTPLEAETRQFGLHNLGMMLGLIALVVVYIFVRVKLSRKREASSTYRPRRFDMTPEEDVQSRVNIDRDQRNSPEDKPQ